MKVKPPQSGKTIDAIIKPSLDSIKNDRIPIIIIPPRLQLQYQLTTRIRETVIMIDNKPKRIKLKSIGRFDSGSNPRLESVEHALERLDKNKIVIFIILNNTYGMNKLLYTLYNKPEYKFDVIIDEAHEFFNIQSNLNLMNISDIIGKFKNGQQDQLILDSDECIICLLYLIDKYKWTISATTATVCPIGQIKAYEKIGIRFPVILLPIPDCYFGYNKINKIVYNSDKYKIAFNEIMKTEYTETTTMCHVGRNLNEHEKAGSIWNELGIKYGRNSVSIIDNQLGYTIIDKEGLREVIQKDKLGEPWMIINLVKSKGYTHIGVFGDQCMSESNTYQKCNNGINIPLNHLVVIKFGNSLSKMTAIIQKVGRIFGNDTTGKLNKRTIWFPEQEYKLKFEEGVKLDSFIQDKGIVNNYTYKESIKYIKDSRKIHL